ncbi:hypothetical protein BU24DRAFT_50425 [Aaosphaeria arxii CBS 175.79]|uniref:Uncharacterized protein n=1 Tax=Aaosphaeria arxii CBS 175.79 TaxID=1450172 RepID=A0A6A5XCZ5_9PLEO|nr:uncharacterized protein BU24DRAFT_50425 [Aaosphaeria arxii CBS 175.79]KAF2010985.1 hypothetical protein BU24DRAFT_50425 [Aaosphaeria arxii CBS 175.79]
MIAITSIILLSALSNTNTAFAKLTTSIWMPNGMDDDSVTFRGSVIGANKEAVTLALAYNEPYNASEPMATVTVAPTFWATQTTLTDPETSGDYTYSAQCSKAPRARAGASCSYSFAGVLAHAMACADFTQQAEWTTDSYTLPAWCTEGTELPASLARDVFTLAQSEIGTYEVIITAGEEKLSAVATTGASVTPSSAQSTGSNTTPTGTGSSTAASAAQSGSSGTGTATTSETGAAVPLRTMAPALAGFGAALAMFVV